MWRRTRVYLVLCSAVLCFLVSTHNMTLRQCQSNTTARSSKHVNRTSLQAKEGKSVTRVDTNEHMVLPRDYLPLYWISGLPGSGTSLLSAILDSHLNINCKTEHNVVERIVRRFQETPRSAAEKQLLDKQNEFKTINAILGDYMLDLLNIKSIDPNVSICINDNEAILNLDSIVRIFPRSCFILVVRDGRAVVHSELSKKNITDPKLCQEALRQWDKDVEIMYRVCEGNRHKCFMINYDDLVEQPRDTLYDLIQFIGAPWSDKVLEHETHVLQKRGRPLTPDEAEKQGIHQPINDKSVLGWIKSSMFSTADQELIKSIAPMVEKLTDKRAPVKMSELQVHLINTFKFHELIKKNNYGKNNGNNIR